MEVGTNDYTMNHLSRINEKLSLLCKGDDSDRVKTLLGDISDHLSLAMMSVDMQICRSKKSK